MCFAAVHEAVQAVALRAHLLRPGAGGDPLDVVLQLGEAGAADLGGDLGATQFDHFRRQPHGLEQL